MKNKEYLKILVAISIVVISGYILKSVYNKCYNRTEGFRGGFMNDSPEADTYNAMSNHENSNQHNDQNNHVNNTNKNTSANNSSANSMENFETNTVDDSEYNDMRQSNCFPQAQLSPNELLPLNDESSAWASVNQTSTFEGKNFLQAGWTAGISSVGSTLRNANRQLRSEPPNPQVRVSPWMQTTVEPDITRKPFEIGGCA